jgi:drug/metabolite transporter (DMT)-like permease
MTDGLRRMRLSIQAGSRAALLSAALFGLSTPFAKGLLQVISPQLLAGLFYLGAGIGLTFLKQIAKKGPVSNETPLTRGDLPWLSGAIASGGIVAPVLLYVGLQQTLASDASLLLNLEGVFTVLLAWLLFREDMGRRVSLGIAAVLLGSVVVSWRTPSSGGLWGALLIAIACVCWGFDNNLTQRVSARDPREIAALKGLAAGTVNVILAVWVGSSFPAVLWLVTAFGVGFVTFGLSLVFYVAALRQLGTARTGAYYSLGPFIGAIAGLILWHEPVTLPLGLGSVAMLIGVWFLLSERHIHFHVHELLVHSHQHIHDRHHRHQHSSSDPSGRPHSHRHEHKGVAHTHPHYPDINHRHSHDRKKPRDGERKHATNAAASSNNHREPVLRMEPY